jgi:phosphatidylserine decarboxylase
VIRVAPEGWPFIAIAWVIVAVLAWFRVWPALVLWLPIAVWVIAFFRDPGRSGPRGDDVIIAPADGKVVSVIPIDEPAFLRGQATRISIFMNVFDVHVNRYPSRGRVVYRHYMQGRFLNASGEKASADNEQSSVGLETPRGRILVRQIAGLVARRIVTDHGEGTEVQQAGRMGMIRFGSRVDVFLPAPATAMVRPGDVTRAGQTVIGQWK